MSVEALDLVEVFYWVFPVQMLFGGHVLGEAGKGAIRVWHPLPNMTIDVYAPLNRTGPSDSTMLVLPIYPWIYTEDL